MNYQSYPFVLNEDKTHYKFVSSGKRGVFEKAIAFSRLTDHMYNLALLDFDPQKQDYTDESVTDNGDMPNVLATVISVIIDYLKNHPERYITLVGNTESRTRLYQIAINKVLSEVEDVFVIFGYRDETWVPFERNSSYEGFLIGKKQ